jgi:hypothetical protein
MARTRKSRYLTTSELEGSSGMEAIAVRASDIARWWARENDDVVLRERCAAGACSDDACYPFDVYCSAPESHLLVLGTRPRIQTWAVYGVRGLFGALVLASAKWSSAIPLQVVSVLFGLLLLALPLRMFRATAINAPICWIALFALLAIADDTAAGGTIHTILAGGGAALLLIGVVVAVAMGDPGMDLTRRGVGATFAFAANSAALAAILLGIGTLRGVAHALLLIALLAATGAASAAAVIGLIRGGRGTHYEAPLMRRHTPPSLNGPRERDLVRRRGFAMSLLFVLQRVALRLAAHSARIANFLLRVLWRATDLIVFQWDRFVAFVAFVARLLAAAAKAFVGVLVEAVAAAVAAATGWVLSRALAVVLLGAAALAAITASSDFAAYLKHGGLADCALSVALSVAAVAAIIIAWWPLTELRYQDVYRGAQRLAEAGGPPFFITLVVLGWADGILGLVGIGPMRPGWLTFAGTAILLSSLAYAWQRSRDGQTEARGTA